MQVRSYSPADLPTVHRLLAANGWSHRIGDAAALGRLIAASQRTAVALHNGEAVGFARAITDGLSNGYLSMVVVAEPFRRQGIGQALLEAIVGADPNITWMLRAGRDGAPAFFAKLGFVASTLAMERPRGAQTPRANLSRARPESAMNPATATRAQAKIAIRPGVTSDAHALAALSIQVWLATYATDGVNDLLARHVLDEFTAPRFASLAEAPDTALLVAEMDAHLLGYALVGFSAPQALAPACDTELRTLYVQEAFTGAGVGASLLEAARTAVRERTGNDALWLSVNARNHRARRFYEKHRFVIKGQAWFALGEDRHENNILSRP